MPTGLDDIEDWREQAGIIPPDGRRFWITEDMVTYDPGGKPSPWYGTHTVAEVFFGRSAAWLRVRMRPTDEWPDSHLTLDGQPLGIFRSESGDRQFSLLDIERTAHALFEKGSLDRYRFAVTIKSVTWAARQRRWLKDWFL
jgi:hypothetical protein